MRRLADCRELHAGCDARGLPRGLVLTSSQAQHALRFWSPIPLIVNAMAEPALFG